MGYSCRVDLPAHSEASLRDGFLDSRPAWSRQALFKSASERGGLTAASFRLCRQPTFKSSAGAAFQTLHACVSLSACGIEGDAKTPLIMNRKIRRPADALQAASTGRTGQSAAHLIEGGFRILPAKSGIRGLRQRQAQEKHRTREQHRLNKRNSRHPSVRHVASPWLMQRPHYAALAEEK